MNLDQNAYIQIAKTLAGHFDSLYFVDLETGHFKELFSSPCFAEIGLPSDGDDYFSAARDVIERIAHPENLDMLLSFQDRSTIFERLKVGHPISVSAPLTVNGKPRQIRYIFIMCEDEKHMIFCMENIDEEYLEKEEQKRSLESARRLARRDELTGIRNKNAFTEFSDNMDKKIREKVPDLQFAILMGDVNDLKLINDTRGHSFGDEAIQRASRMICEIYKHSPVFRIGGDEFAVVIMGEDYDNRDILLNTLREESTINGQTASGPVVACGMGVFDPVSDFEFIDVFKRADKMMYENKNELKIAKVVMDVREAHKCETPIPGDRRRALDKLFGALITVSGGGYVYLNDLRYDFSRWSLSLIDDFNMESEYMYHAGQIWHKYIHPDDMKAYEKAVEAAICGKGELTAMTYRARLATGEYIPLTTRAFILNDADGKPEYFGGIIVPQ